MAIHSRVIVVDKPVSAGRLHGPSRAAGRPLPGSLLRLLLALLLGLLLGGADCLGDLPECGARCDVEVECGFRSLEECKAASCDPLTGEPKSSSADDCLASADDCAEAAACACEDGCARIDECADSGAADATCAATCATLVDQTPTQTYMENRCRIEATDCSTLVTCSTVSG
jgi:hypothetical protein